MTAAPDRIEQLKADLAELKVDDPAAGADRLATRLGLLGLAAGIILAVVAYAMSHGTDNPLSQRDALVLALIGVTVSIAGAALYLKGALSGFLRFWLVRDLHERRIQTDRLLDARSTGDRTAGGEGT
ncbi:MAG TPA: hypothetical protein VK007_13955 [Acidimicrobiales bacterium]|nr:hypothetical protein [Acidimicrobiales bacterium]